MKKGIIYVRVSSIDQTQGTSLDNQERACREYAEKNGIEVVRAFIEKGESATAANRTEFLKALDFCRKSRGELKYFIVWKIDRFARNTTDHFSVRAKLTQYGVVLQSVTEPITQDHMGKLMETFLAGYAEFENEVRKQRCTGGMQGRLREGVWCWWPPIGYTHSKRLKDRRKTTPDIADEERFFLIQKGLRLYQAGNHSITALAVESRQWGLTTRTGKPMSKQLWEKILKDKFYAGVLVDPWTGEEHRGLHKQMISRDEFDQIQKVKKGKSSSSTGHRLSMNPDFPLRGFVRCECHQPFTASWSRGRSKRYASYHCHNKKCVHFGRSVPKDALENKFFNFLQDVCPSTEFLEFFKQTVVQTYEQQLASDELETEFYQRERVKLEKRLRELLEIRINGEISRQEYKDLKSVVETQISRLPNSHEQKNDGFVDMGTIVARTSDFITELASNWKTMPLLKKQRLQKAVLPLGMTYHKTSNAIGTAILSPIFRLNEQFRHKPSELVAEVRSHWNQIIQDIRNISALVAEQ
ncbi:MAG: recombinase family protein [Limisphaerales bacterium]